MDPNDVPEGDKIHPGETCPLCGEELTVIDIAGDVEDTVWIGCPNSDELDDGHICYGGVRRSALIAWGWDI